MLRAALILTLLALPLHAGTWGNPPPENVAQAEVLPGWREGGRHVAALRIRLAPGWKTYWRAPGETGIPPEFSWRGSVNLGGVAIHWPVPEVFTLNGSQSIGYSGEVVLPLFLDTAGSGPAELRGRLEMGICRDVCLPFALDFAAVLPPDGAPDATIRAALADRALNAAEGGVTAVACAVEAIADGLRLTATLSLPQRRGEVVVVEPGSPGIWASEATSRRDGSRLTASADLVPPDARPFALDRSKLRITVLSPGRAVEIRGCPAG